MSEGQRRVVGRSQTSSERHHHRRTRTKGRIRGGIALSLIIVWSLAALTGFLLYVAPEGQFSGQTVLLFLTEREWDDVHFWVSVAAIVITAAHLSVDRKGVKAALRFLISAERGHSPRE